MILILTIARAGGWQRDTGSVMDPLIKINAVLRDSRDALHQLWRHFVSIANVGTGVLGPVSLERSRCSRDEPLPH